MIIRTKIYERVRANSELFKYLTGISPENFDAFKTFYYGRLHRGFTSKVRASASGSYPDHTIFFLSFVYANRFISYECFAQLMGASKPDAKRANQRIMPLIIDALYSEDRPHHFSEQLAANVNFISSYAAETGGRYPSGNIPIPSLLIEAAPERFREILRTCINNPAPAGGAGVALAFGATAGATSADKDSENTSEPDSD